MEGICFVEPLFHKVVDGTKTQTRRIIFRNVDYTFWSQPSFLGMETDPEDCFKLDKDGEMACYKNGEPKLVKFKGTFALFEGDQFYFDNSYIRPRYQPGEIVFLKEPYHLSEHPPIISYRFDKDSFAWTEIEYKKLWRNKLFMPEAAARYFIQITDVAVQRLNDITEADAIAEGFKNIADFQNTWITIHGWSSLKENPWVFKYDFILTNLKPYYYA